MLVTSSSRLSQVRSASLVPDVASPCRPSGAVRRSARALFANSLAFVSHEFGRRRITPHSRASTHFHALHQKLAGYIPSTRKPIRESVPRTPFRKQGPLSWHLSYGRSWFPDTFLGRLKDSAFTVNTLQYKKRKYVECAKQTASKHCVSDRALARCIELFDGAAFSLSLPHPEKNDVRHLPAVAATAVNCRAKTRRQISQKGKIKKKNVALLFFAVFFVCGAEVTLIPTF